MMQRENKKRGRDEVTEEKTSEKCAKKKMHQKNTDKNNRPDLKLDEVVGVFDFPWIKDGTMFSTTISEDDWYLEGTFLASLRGAIEDEGEFLSQFSWSAAGGGLMLEFLPEIGDESSSVDNSIWASVLNQPLGRSI